MELPAIPAAMAPLFLKPALLSYEQKDEYFDLVEALSSVINPADAVEWLWLKDLVDLHWELNRLRRSQVALLRGERTRAVRATLGLRRSDGETNRVRLWAILNKYAGPGPDGKPRFGPDPSEPEPAPKPIKRSDQGGPDITPEEAQELAKRGTSSADLLLNAWVDQLGSLERVDRLIRNMEHRRDALLERIEARRADQERENRLALANVTDAEVTSSSPPRRGANWP